MSPPMEINTLMKHATSASAVASVDDLLLEILLHLPIRSLLRFKSVSKHWLSLISNPKFFLTHNNNRNPKPALGLFLPGIAICDTPKFEYIPFDFHNSITAPPFSKLEFAKDPSGIIILQSCNGLLLCSSFRVQEPKRFYYVYNPTTKQFITLPKPGGSTGASRIIHGVSLAFDPAKFSHYKVICVRGSDLSPKYYQIEIYSSESGSWRISGDAFTADHIDFQSGVYWNDAVHWISFRSSGGPLYFNVDKERLEAFPTPAIPDNWQIDYFGESCDHLHLIATKRFQIQFNVYELKRDYSEWFVKYQVDLAALTTTFPRMTRKLGRIVCSTRLHERGWVRSINLNPTDLCEYAFSVFALIRGEKEDDAFLVLQIPGKAIRYNLVSKQFQKLCDFEGDEEEGCLRYNSRCASPYIESLYCV